MVFNLNRIYVGFLLILFVLIFNFTKLDLIFFFLIYFISFFEVFKNKILDIKLTILFFLIGFLIFFSSYVYDLSKFIIFLSFLSLFQIFFFNKIKNFFFSLVVILFFINSFLLLNNSRDLFYFVIFISFFNDTVAYIFGNLIQGPKITPVISPKKTWSGTIISVISSSLLIYFYLNSHIFICFLMSLSLFFGDIFFSIIKRDLKIKDFSNILKSHGGILDRLDSMIFLPLIINLIFFLK